MPGPRVSTGDRLSATHLPRRGTLSRLQLALRAACAGVLCAADPRRGLVPPTGTNLIRRSASHGRAAGRGGGSTRKSAIP